MTSVSQPADKLDLKSILPIIVIVFVDLLGLSIIIPLLPFYAETFGASPVVIGLLFAAYSLAQLVAAPVLGALSDRFGRRPVLIFSLIGTVVSFAMLAVAHSMVMLFAARVIDGVADVPRLRVSTLGQDLSQALRMRLLLHHVVGARRAQMPNQARSHLACALHQNAATL